MANLLQAAMMVVRNKIDDGWTMEEAISWAASQYRVAIDDLITALAVDMGDLAYD
jgi:hypothetical protein